MVVVVVVMMMIIIIMITIITCQYNGKQLQEDESRASSCNIAYRIEIHLKQWTMCQITLV
jgi:hypothetical protein